MVLFVYLFFLSPKLAVSLFWPVRQTSGLSCRGAEAQAPRHLLKVWKSQVQAFSAWRDLTPSFPLLWNIHSPRDFNSLQNPTFSLKYLTLKKIWRLSDFLVCWFPLSKTDHPSAEEAERALPGSKFSVDTAVRLGGIGRKEPGTGALPFTWE